MKGVRYWAPFLFFKKFLKFHLKVELCLKFAVKYINRDIVLDII